jgi:NAD(P)-dependent dehydrogenase (short-subunit alcohol dehydrogenase family)
MRSLSDKVALVTGSSRGIGKGIALALAEQGATVYVTGRTVRAGEHALPGSIHDTADDCTRRGGRGIPVAVDHANDLDVAQLFERIEQEHGRLDLLVNNAFALPDDLTAPLPFWKKPLSNWEMVDVGVRSSFVAAWHAARLMAERGSGLIAAISGYTGATYTYSAVFGMCKAAVDRLAHDMAVELQPYGVASISLWQGLTLTERAKRNLELNPDMKSQIVTNPNIGCSPEFPGRVLVALLQDANLMELTGGTFITAELAQNYGVTDVDGRIIESLRAQRGAPIWLPLSAATGNQQKPREAR